VYPEKIAETSVVLIVFNGVIYTVGAYYVTHFFLSLYLNQVPAMLYKIHDLITLKFIWPPLLVFKILQLQDKFVFFQLGLRLWDTNVGIWFCGLGVFWINVYQIRSISKVSSQNNHKIFGSKRSRNWLCSPVAIGNKINRKKISEQFERLESQIIYSFGSNRSKGPNKDRQNQLRSLMLEGGEP
jgi:hypothetical protein